MHQYLFEVIRGAIADIDKAHNVATAAVEAAQDPVTAFAGAKELAAHMQALAEADAKLATAGAAELFETTPPPRQHRTSSG